MMLGWGDPDARAPAAADGRAALRWGGALVAVLAVHAGLILAVGRQQVEVPAAEPPPAVTIDLAPPDVASSRASTAAPAEVPPQVPDLPQPTAPQPLQLPSAAPQADAPPPVPLPETAEGDLPPPPPLTRASADPDPPLSARATAPAASPPPEPAPATAAPDTSPRPPPRPAPPVKTPKPPTPKAAHSRPAIAAAPEIRSQRRDRSVAPTSGAGQVASTAVASWKSRLLAHLDRYKRFPPGARGAGTVGVAFSIDRAGRVLAARIVRSSGDAVLDRAAAAIPARASPVPAPPDGFAPGKAVLQFTVPVNFERPGW